MLPAPAAERASTLTSVVLASWIVLPWSTPNLRRICRTTVWCPDPVFHAIVSCLAFCRRSRGFELGRGALHGRPSHACPGAGRKAVAVVCYGCWCEALWPWHLGPSPRASRNLACAWLADWMPVSRAHLRCVCVDVPKHCGTPVMSAVACFSIVLCCLLHAQQHCRQGHRKVPCFVAVCECVCARVCVVADSCAYCACTWAALSSRAPLTGTQSACYEARAGLCIAGRASGPWCLLHRPGGFLTQHSTQTMILSPTLWRVSFFSSPTSTGCEPPAQPVCSCTWYCRGSAVCRPPTLGRLSARQGSSADHTRHPLGFFPLSAECKKVLLCALSDVASSREGCLEGAVEGV